MINSDAVIAGIGLTKQAKSLQDNNLTVCVEAVENALADAGMTMKEIDGISARWPGPGGSKFNSGVVD